MSKEFNLSPIEEADEVYAFFSQFDELSIDQVKRCADFHFKKMAECSGRDMLLFYDIARVRIKNKGVSA